MENSKILRKPSWLKTQLPEGSKYLEVNQIVKENNLHTICSSGKCPNIADCWTRGTATFMILGDICTRSCKFCNVKTGKPLPVNPFEPQAIATSVSKMKLKHCVITSVDRDDLPDGGANHWASTINAIKIKNPEITIESLIPDFDGNQELINIVIKSGSEIISHNLETVRRITPIVRSRAKYETSLKVIEIVSKSGTISKSGIMVGLGETTKEVISVMDDLLNVGCKVFTIGQYLQPTHSHIPVNEYVNPDVFKYYDEIGLQKGFLHVESGPLVRSSYHAEKHI